MMALTSLDFITINGTQIRKPEVFNVQVTDVYEGEYTTCTGKLIADRIGWKYEDMNITWGALPQESVDALIAMDGTATITFDDQTGATVTELCRRNSVVGLRHRYTINGTVWWKDVTLTLTFLNTHTN